MLRQIKEVVRNTLNGAGIEIRKNEYLDPLKLQHRLLNLENPVIFDVGAYVGKTALNFRSSFSEADIHAFEPYPESFEKLKDATVHDTKIHRHQIALGREMGESTLQVNKAKATNSLLGIAEDAGELWGEGRLERHNSVSIVVDTVDNFCHCNDIEKINLLKMDVQGLEYDVLQGAKGMLIHQKIDLVYQEILLVDTYSGQKPLGEYLTLMSGFGYQMIDLFEPMRRNGRLLQMDILYASSKLLGALPKS